MSHKDRLRTHLIARRAALRDAVLATAESGLARRAEAVVAESGARTVAAYLTIGPEPSTWALLDALLTAGTTVIVPRALPDRELSWVRYEGRDDLVRGRFAIPEPAGPADPAGLAGVDLVVVPALAVDPAGFRLGRGGGYYDKALAEHPGPMRVALLHDHEIVDDTHPEPHDERVDVAVTPARTLHLPPR